MGKNSGQREGALILRRQRHVVEHRFHRQLPVGDRRPAGLRRTGGGGAGGRSGLPAAGGDRSATIRGRAGAAVEGRKTAWRPSRWTRCCRRSSPRHSTRHRPASSPDGPVWASGSRSAAGAAAGGGSGRDPPSSALTPCRRHPSADRSTCYRQANFRRLSRPAGSARRGSGRAVIARRGGRGGGGGRCRAAGGVRVAGCRDATGEGVIRGRAETVGGVAAGVVTAVEEVDAVLSEVSAWSRNVMPVGE